MYYVKRNIHLFICLALFTLFINCKNSDKKNKKGKSTYLEQNTQALSKRIDLSSVSSVELSPQAKEASSNWLKFLSANSELKKFNNYSLQELINNKNNLSQSFKNLQDSIPKQFDVVPVQSRITVLVTKSDMFKEYGNRERIDSKEVQVYGQEIYKAFTDLKIQLNEVFLEQLPEFQIDMDKRQDSIRKSKQFRKRE